jgi:type VI protein secretion system component VasK
MSMTNDERGSRPVPDPTVLTTQQLYREIEAAREMTETLIDGLREILDEKFSSVDRQLQLVEQQRVEQKSDTKAAVDAALTAQKEAVKEQTTASERAIAKSEASTTKQLEQLSETFATSLRAMGDKVDDLKDRLTVTEALKQGGRETLTGLYAVVGVVIAAVGLAVTAYIATH